MNCRNSPADAHAARLGQQHVVEREQHQFPRQRDTHRGAVTSHGIRGDAKIGDVQQDDVEPLRKGGESVAISTHLPKVKSSPTI